MRELSCITYAGRKVTVIDGQPFYESSGINSGIPGIWLPFIMVLEDFQVLSDADGTYQSIHAPNRLYGPYLRRRILENQQDDADTTGYFLGFNNNVVNPLLTECLSAQTLEALHPGLSRFLILKNHLITSIQLGCALWENIPEKKLQHLLKLQDHELRFLRKNAASIPTKPDEIVSPSELNAWLLAQGAQDITAIFCCSPSMAVNAADYLTYRLDMFIHKISQTSSDLNLAQASGLSGKSLFAHKELSNIQEKIVSALKRYHEQLKDWIRHAVCHGLPFDQMLIPKILQHKRLISAVLNHKVDFTQAGLENLTSVLTQLQKKLPTLQLDRPEAATNPLAESLALYRSELKSMIDIMGLSTRDEVIRTGTFETTLFAFEMLYLDVHFCETLRDLDAIYLQLKQIIQKNAFLESFRDELPSFAEICKRIQHPSENRSPKIS